MIFLSSHPSIEEKGEDVFLKIIAHPNSSRKQISITENSIDIYVNEPPDKGRANKAILKLLSKSLKLPSSSMSILKGVKSKNKVIMVKNCNKNFILEKVKII